MPDESPLPIPILEEFDEMGALVGIVIGSESDREAIEPAGVELNERGISWELKVLSAHRNPRAVAEYASTAALRGTRVLIAGAAGRPALPGTDAAWTTLPVIGVRWATSDLNGLDALLSIVQMPPGIPVATLRSARAARATPPSSPRRSSPRAAAIRGRPGARPASCSLRPL